MAFILGVGLYGFATTTYVIKTFEAPEDIFDDMKPNERFLSLFSSNFSPLAG